MSHAAALRVTGLDLSFGGLKALRGIELQAGPGQVTGLIGPNGAGKTSLFNCLTGLYRPQKGSVVLGETELVGKSAAQRARLGVARTFQRPALCDELTVLENVSLGSSARGQGSWIDAFIPLPRSRAGRRELQERSMQTLEVLGLAKYSQETMASVSPGIRRMVEIARALAAQPELLLLDEPAAGLNSAETRNLLQLIRNIVTPKLAVVLVEHDMELVMNLCDKIYVLNFGELIASGTPEEVRHNPEVIRVYLGDDDQ